MFGLSMREKLIKFILEDCASRLPIYENSIRSSLQQPYDQLPPDSQVSNPCECIHTYLDAVATSVFNDLMNQLPDFRTSFSQVIANPPLCGYDIAQPFGLQAGSIYAMCFYAITGMPAAPDDCIALNHRQHEMMTDVVMWVKKDLGNK